jgi:hypothetical protein
VTHELGSRSAPSAYFCRIPAPFRRLNAALVPWRTPSQAIVPATDPYVTPVTSLRRARLPPVSARHRELLHDRQGLHRRPHALATGHRPALRCTIPRRGGRRFAGHEPQRRGIGLYHPASSGWFGRNPSRLDIPVRRAADKNVHPTNPRAEIPGTDSSSVRQAGSHTPLKATSLLTQSRVFSSKEAILGGCLLAVVPIVFLEEPAAGCESPGRVRCRDNWGISDRLGRRCRTLVMERSAAGQHQQFGRSVNRNTRKILEIAVFGPDR